MADRRPKRATRLVPSPILKVGKYPPFQCCAFSARLWHVSRLRRPRPHRHRPDATGQILELLLAPALVILPHPQPFAVELILLAPLPFALVGNRRGNFRSSRGGRISSVSFASLQEKAAMR